MQYASLLILSARLSLYIIMIAPPTFLLFANKNPTLSLLLIQKTCIKAPRRNRPGRRTPASPSPRARRCWWRSAPIRRSRPSASARWCGARSPPPPGQPATVAVKAEVGHPRPEDACDDDRCSKNIDPSLPASHTVDLRVTFDDGAEIKGIKDMRVPHDAPRRSARRRMRCRACGSRSATAISSSGSTAATPSWRTTSISIANRGWFDFPMLLSDDRIAKLTFEKGPDGEQIVNDALAAWK